jgi:hypothetical protein
MRRGRECLFCGCEPPLLVRMMACLGQVVSHTHDWLHMRSMGVVRVQQPGGGAKQPQHQVQWCQAVAQVDVRVLVSRQCCWCDILKDLGRMAAF